MHIYANKILMVDFHQDFIMKGILNGYFCQIITLFSIYPTIP